MGEPRPVHRGFRHTDAGTDGYRILRFYLIGPLVSIEILKGTSLTIDFQWHHYGL